jgi:hypothetical protein
MERRAFLAVSGQAAMLATAASVAKAAYLGQSERCVFVINHDR